MRSRSNSGVRLDYYRRMIVKTILSYQHPVSGLVPATPDHSHAWVRDNVYSILSVWGLALAYRKKADLDEDRAKAYELEQSVVKLMRGLLSSMMKQMDKVEKFKLNQSPKDSLHAKYMVSTGRICVGDHEWGHLQLDATSLYLLQLAQMTASGLQIIYTLDEVSFIQNLVFYIQSAYRTPDFGMWERGDKTNHGVPEINATSIGMARAALEALNGLDLFGARGGPSSIIHVMPDEAQQCQAILHSVLPRESNSKETDAGLLSVISYPAFAVDDPELIELTRNTLLEKLKGRYGLCRFLRDGYKTAKEDPNRLHYDPWELQGFENIECEWPMFYAYLVLDGLFSGKLDQVEEYSNALEQILIKTEDGLKYMPELYAVTADKVDLEYKNPKSQDRVAQGKLPQIWGQSLYVLGRLVKEGFLSPGELDPLNRRLTAEPKPDIVVQVVILAEDTSIQEKLMYYDLKVQTIAEVAPIQVYAANFLAFLFSHLGTNKKLHMSGRPRDVVGVLASSELYTLGSQTLAFFPQFVDQQKFYLPLDTSLLLDMIKTDIQYLGSNWSMMGRPLMVVPIRRSLLDMSSSLHPALVATIKKLQTGYISGTRVHLGFLNDFVSTSCVTDLTFLSEQEDSPDLDKMLRHIHQMAKVQARGTHLLGMTEGPKRSVGTRLRRKSSVKGIIRRSCSIQVEPGELPEGHSDFSSSSGSPISSIPTSPGIYGISTPDLNVPSHPHLKGDDDTEEKIMAYDAYTGGADVNELIQQLKDAESLHEQADIIHYLYTNMGPDWDTKMEGSVRCKVSDLLSELYEKAGHHKQWWLVRHTAGMLRKKVEDLAKAATDIIVRQKQLAVGLPPEPREKIITRPLPPDELATIIHDACGDDNSTAMLTQEILVYLAMFIRTEPRLFKEMLRIRVGLIIQVMATELARTLKCSGEDASDQLLNLSPYEMKTLLHHILSGKEFVVTSEAVTSNNVSERRVSVHSLEHQRSTRSRYSSQAKYSVDRMRHDLQRQSTVDDLGAFHPEATVLTQEDSFESDRQGQWLRRRRLDGALNRVPVGFYSDIWKLLKRCHGLSIATGTLNQSLTSEMTVGEIKFALHVEAVLNKIPQPEYRQLCVESILMLCLIIEHDGGRCHWNEVINVDELVHHGNRLFIEEQKELDGDVTLCCANPKTYLKCGGLAGVCQNFYDLAPSGRYGTMSYLCRSVVHCLKLPCAGDGNLDCTVQ